jgi:hypothetical protein
MMTKEDAATDYMIEMSRLLHLNNESIMNEIYKAFIAGAAWFERESLGEDAADE